MRKGPVPPHNQQSVATRLPGLGPRQAPLGWQTHFAICSTRLSDGLCGHRIRLCVPHAGPSPEPETSSEPPCAKQVNTGDVEPRGRGKRARGGSHQQPRRAQVSRGQAGSPPEASLQAGMQDLSSPRILFLPSNQAAGPELLPGPCEKQQRPAGARRDQSLTQAQEHRTAGGLSGLNLGQASQAMAGKAGPFSRPQCLRCTVGQPRLSQAELAEPTALSISPP